MGLLESFFAGKPEVGKQVRVICDSPQTRALVRPFAAREQSIEQSQP